MLFLKKMSPVLDMFSFLSNHPFYLMKILEIKKTGAYCVGRIHNILSW